MISFEELGVDKEIILALTDLGFENPMPVQEKVIPLMLGGQTDIVALAQTGTGKTAAFGLPLIQAADTGVALPQALILCPTRELCLQITNDLNDYSKYVDDLKILAVYGGSSIENQIKALKKGVQIVVATPGRLIDLIGRKAVKLGKVRSVVLDEADEMLNMGFLDSINEILASVPEERITLLFSATMPAEVASIAKNYMKDPFEVTIGDRNAGAENIKHQYYTVHAKDKYTALKRIVDFYPAIYGIVFCRTRLDTQEVADKLIADGYNAEALHGDLSQAIRDTVMQKFRIRHTQLLVATDVAARGLDVNDLTHVINYSLPDDIQVYTHRSGRTGRAGKTGTSIAIIHLKEKHLIKQIEKKIGKSFIAAKVPGGREICEKQLFNLINKMENVEIEHAEIDPFLPTIYRKLEWLEKEDVIKRFVALEFNRFLDYYRNAPDINVVEDKSRDKGRAKGEGRHDTDRRDNRKEVTRFTRIAVNLGKAEGLYPNNLIELINANSPGKRIRIGDITLEKHSTVFEADSEYANHLMHNLEGVEFRGQELSLSIVKGTGEVTVDQPRSFKGKKKEYRREERGNERKEPFNERSKDPSKEPFKEPRREPRKKPYKDSVRDQRPVKKVYGQVPPVKKSQTDEDPIFSEKEFKEWMSSKGNSDLKFPGAQKKNKGKIKGGTATKSKGRRK